ncbi:ABC transporter substrate-binding protein [Silvanigrella aquatica]|uniref:Solute-binding protein family 3/N-terminal domain-containing protein n=1 Tax=Silvanigrella aquatica TaxID=1915309 RepID=A0A1L4CZP1_9BACT|nr:ABC transporter substrate-binding protein [Silvanigrella aquatica]APJ03424.1 hypothetical protein AXG55_05695 [Silvanigrella aquatica]
MKKKIQLSLFLINFFVAFYSVFFHFHANAEIPPDIKKIITRGKLIVAINSVDLPPFFYKTNDNKLEGFDIEIAEDIAKNLGVHVEYNRNASTFQDVVKLVENEHADIAMGSISATLARGLTVRFSDPYLLPNQCLILNRIIEVKVNNKVKIDPEVFKIALLSHSSYNDYAKQNINYFDTNYKNISFIEYDSLDNAISDVISGKIFGVYTDENYANNVIKTKKLANIYVRKKIVSDSIDPISIALNWKSPNLAYWINLYIKRMKTDGKEKLLTFKYLREKNDK